MEIKSILKPEGSVVSGIAVAGSVWAIYNQHVGSVAEAHASDANHPVLESSRKKAAFQSFLLVSAITLITRDGNVGVLGYGAIIAMELSYRHAIMANPETGTMQAPVGSLYQAADTTVAPQNQGQNSLLPEDFQ